MRTYNFKSTLRQRSEPNSLHGLCESPWGPSAAGWWNDAIHSQIFDNLAVVVPGMAQGVNDQTRARSIVECLQRRFLIVLFDRSCRPVQVGE